MKLREGVSESDPSDITCGIEKAVIQNSEAHALELRGNLDEICCLFVIQMSEMFF